MLIQDIARAYETKTDEELLQLATESEQLTLEAHSALTTELARRRIDSAEPLSAQERSAQGEIARRGSRAHPSQPEVYAVGYFIAEVPRGYHCHLLLFPKLTSP